MIFALIARQEFLNLVSNLFLFIRIENQRGPASNSFIENVRHAEKSAVGQAFEPGRIRCHA